MRLVLIIEDTRGPDQSEPQEYEEMGSEKKGAACAGPRRVFV